MYRILCREKDINYSNTHFYKIVCKDLQIDKCYVGHTTNFAKRKNTHKNNCNNKKHNTYLYQFIRENGGFNNFEMVLLETLDCNSRLEALRTERQYIEELKATLNQIKPHAANDDRTQQALDYNQRKRQDRLDNPDKYKERDKQKYQNNKEAICQKAKERYNEKKDEIKEQKQEYYYNRGGQEKNSIRCKKYREEHPEERKISMKRWYDSMKQEVECECGQKVFKHNLPIHITRRRHQEYLNNQANEEFLQTTQDNE